MEVHVSLGFLIDLLTHCLTYETAGERMRLSHNVVQNQHGDDEQIFSWKERAKYLSFLIGGRTAENQGQEKASVTCIDCRVFLVNGKRKQNQPSREGWPVPCFLRFWLCSQRRGSHNHLYSFRVLAT